MAQQSYLPVDATSGMASVPMSVGTGPAGSSSYGAQPAHDSFTSLPQRSVQGGYPNQPQQMGPPLQQARPPAMRQASQQMWPGPGQQPLGPQRALAPPAQATPLSASMVASPGGSPQRPPASQAAVRPQPAASPQLMMRPAAPAFATVSGPFQSVPTSQHRPPGPPQSQAPPNVAMWGRPGLGPPQAQPPATAMLRR